ncbi:MAG: hypothetical protein EOM77_03675 [Bacteroidia bacterium]|nr:hypothetical protein [Bacteroidia bacterium]
MEGGEYVNAADTFINAWCNRYGITNADLISAIKSYTSEGQTEECANRLNFMVKFYFAVDSYANNMSYAQSDYNVFMFAPFDTDSNGNKYADDFAMLINNFEETSIKEAYGDDYADWLIALSHRSSAILEEPYQMKLGFAADDRYLIGHRSCGMFVYPNFSSSNAKYCVRNATARKRVEIQSSVGMPIMVEYRMTDYMGYIDGLYNSTNVQQAPSYTKRIGIDLWESYDYDGLGMCDIIITAKYNKSSIVNVSTISSDIIASVNETNIR